MNKSSCNCIICAKEFDPNENKVLALAKINITRFKICKECFDNSDPEDDYKQARDVVDSYLNLITAKIWFKEAQNILDSMVDDTTIEIEKDF